jgi:hypothetical protein
MQSLPQGVHPVTLLEAESSGGGGGGGARASEDVAAWVAPALDLSDGRPLQRSFAQAPAALAPS